MALKLKTIRKSKGLQAGGLLVAVFALIMQPFGEINFPAAFAVNSNIAKIELEAGASQEVKVDSLSGESSVRLQNQAGENESAESGVKLAMSEQPAVNPEITALKPVLWSGDNYKGISIDTRFVNVTGLQGATITVNRADGSTVTKTMKQARIDAINAANGAALSLTAPFTIQEMTYSEADSGSWSLPSTKEWTAATVPTSVEISFVFADSSKSVSETAQINNRDIAYISLLPPVDSTPQTTLVTPTGIVGSKFKITGTATDNEALNRVYVQLVNREDHKRYGGTTVNLIGKGVKADWSVEYDVKKQKLPEGRYAAHVSVVDMQGNTSSQGWSENFIVDATGPVFNSVLPTTGTAINKDFTVTVDVTDKVVDVQKIALYVVNTKTNEKVHEYSMTKGAGSEWTTLVKLSDLDGDATYDLRFRAVDSVNNATYHNNRGGAYLVTVDATLPVAQVVSPSDGDVVGGMVDLKITASDDNLAAYSYRIGNVDTNQKVVEKSGKRTESINNGTVYSWETKKVADGQYYLYVSARDTAGNRDEHRVNVTVDNTAPKASLISTDMNPAELTVGIEDVHPQGTYAVNVYTKDRQLKGTICRGDFGVGETSRSCTTDVEVFKSLSDGEYYFKANVTDAAGNNSAHGEDTTAIHPFTIDRNPPAQVTGLAIHDDDGLVSDGFTNDFRITAKWNAVGDAAKYEYCYWNSIDTSIYREENCYTTHPTGNQQSGVLNQGEGEHYVKVRAIDAAGNVGEWSEAVSFIYDKTAPDAQLIASNHEPKVGDTVTVTGSVSDEPHIKSHWFEITQPDGKTQVYVTEMNTSEKSHTFTLNTSAGAGNYKIRYVATDRAGNRSDAPNYSKSKVLFVVVAPADEDNNPMTVTINPIEKTITSLSPKPTINGTVVRDIDEAPVANQDVTVRIMQDGKIMHELSATTKETGEWTVEVPDDLKNGKYEVVAAIGNTTSETEHILMDVNVTPVPKPKKTPPQRPTANKTNPPTEITTNPLTEITTNLLTGITTNPLTLFARVQDPVVGNVNDAPVQSQDDEGEVLGESTINTQDDELDRDNDGEVLAAQDSNTNWSVVNALLAIVATVMGVIALLGLFARRAEGEESKVGSRIISGVLAVGAVVGLFIVEDFTAPMAIVNIWTWLFAAIVVAQAVMTTIIRSSTEE